MDKFGAFDRALVRISLLGALLIAYGKMLSDFAEFYITGHTRNFFWVFGDIFYNASNPANNPGSYSLVGLLMLAVLGWANLQLWVKEFSVAQKFATPYCTRFENKLADYILVKLKKSASGKGRKARLSSRILGDLTKMGQALEENKQYAREKKVLRLERAVSNAKAALKEAKEDLNTTATPDSTVGVSE